MKIIVSYSFTRDAGNPGFCDVGMAFVLGFQRLGHEVYLVEEVTPDRCYDGRHKSVAFESWKGIQQFEALAKSYGVWPRCCLVHTEPLATHGMSPRELVKVAAEADLVVIISGKIESPILLENFRNIAYVDINPAKTQVYHSEYGVDYGFANYHHFFTVGLNIGTARCEIPAGGLNWRGILQPVVLDLWTPRFDESASCFTTISTWAGRNTFYLNGKFSGEKSDQWLNFIELPRSTRQPMAIALKAGRGYQEQIQLFEKHGWHLSDARQLRNFADYRDYIAGSRAEFSIGNNRYVEFNTGWFSDRSARYLAAGKPVLVQATGFEEHLPTGKGLLAFRTLEEAAALIEEINRDYTTHSRAARSIAEEYFDSDRVLGRMLSETGVQEVADVISA